MRQLLFSLSSCCFGCFTLTLYESSVCNFGYLLFIYLFILNMYVLFLYEMHGGRVTDQAAV